jgi:MYXO-CTERM domain-containing protein
LATQSRLSFGTYTPSALLTIDNFNYGSTLIFKSDLTSSINNTNSFVFNNGGIASTSWNQSTSTFTITAIPEPSTYIAALGLLGLCLLPLVRRKRAKVA